MKLQLYRGDEESNPSSDDQFLGQFIPLHYHYQMLQDVDRMRGFKTAIEASVSPGMTVLELGSGTGVLSSFAARCGAKVHSIERNPELVACSRKLIQDNRLGDSVTIVHGDAAQYVPDKPVDVVICEMLHVALLREKQLQVIAAFKENYLKAFGPPLPRFIPEASLLTVQMVQHCYNFEGYIAPIPVFQPPAVESAGTVELSSPFRYGEIIYSDPFPIQFAVDRKIRTERNGTFNAIRLLTQNILSIDEHMGTFVSWANQFLVLPIDQPMQLTSNEMVPIKFAYRSGDEIETFRDGLSVSTPMSRRQTKAA